jgi:hypothetical protein
MPGSLIFRDASSRDVFLAIARFAGISLAFDVTFRTPRHRGPSQRRSAR